MYTPQEVMRLLPAAGFRVEAFRAEQEIVVVCRPEPDQEPQVAAGQSAG
jgi:hypothetical protein